MDSTIDNTVGAHPYPNLRAICVRFRVPDISIFIASKFVFFINDAFQYLPVLKSVRQMSLFLPKYVLELRII